MSERTGHVPLPELLAQLETSHVVEPMRSRTAEMLIARPRPGVDARTLLVKYCERHHVPSAEAAYEVSVRCDAAGQRDNHTLVPSPECWGSDPAYVCHEYVASRAATAVLKDLLSSGIDDNTKEALAIVARTGATLARFHRALPLTPAGQQRRARSPKLHWIARSLVRARRGRGAPSVHLHTDYGPYNLILTDNDEMLIVDLPGSDRVGLPEEDLGRLIDSVSRRIPASNAKLRAALVDAALTGYESESDIRVRTGSRRALVESFAVRHALLMVLDGVRRLSRGRMRQGFRSITSARRRVRANR